MKKLFLILVSVLVLGGCSVDDDVVGGDDMSITTYPNVVEASRTVVEGGYLVDYVYTGGEISDFIDFLIEKVVGSKSFTSGSFVRDKIENLLSLNIIFKFGGKQVSNEIYDIYNFSLMETRVIEFYDNSDEDYGVRINFNFFNVLLSGVFTITKNTNGTVKMSSTIGDFVKGRFTIFEPSK